MRPSFALFLCLLTLTTTTFYFHYFFSLESNLARDGFNMQPLPFEQFDYSSVFGRCCENVIGTPSPFGRPQSHQPLLSCVVSFPHARVFF